MSKRTQKLFIAWSWTGGMIFFLDFGFLFHMLPPPSARWSAAEIAAFYAEHSGEIKLGAAIAGWTSGFMVPLVIVIAIQMYRHERGRIPVWTMLGCAGGLLMTVFFALPAVLFGAAAYTPDRSPEVTASMHEFGVLTFVTTDMFYVFWWVAVIVICLTPNSVIHTPFKRWFGYLTAWALLMNEMSVIPFLSRSGPFAWNGLLSFWAPFFSFGVWMVAFTVLVIKALNAQSDDELSTTSPRVPAAA